ncbi:type II toxin-antitoxin system CcdA family antitoxin [Streptomyces niveiscabiei]|uniref:type II toxin-antitoxin system CcdA family antitoxin n=1 Tax=Streptomyces niveiscabiei TaxID=164115 RepID=UPI0029B67BED|nr:type II toxin-antitoxin system CcdA family antitoxin [Streptomyces niveiscabiei]MDX3384127.1 type II toxin-antitoxin system CcdA family antitoxin [Streptomyces niveiscabiei]
MAAKKITITVPEELVEAARGLTSNVSGYAAEALADRIRHDLLGEALRLYQEEHGAFTAEEMAEADALLLGTSESDASAQADAA